MGALLLLEYGLAASVVAVGWARLCRQPARRFRPAHPAAVHRPRRLHADARRRAGAGRRPDGHDDLQPARLPDLHRARRRCWSVGVSESAKVNNVIVAIKVSVLVAFIVVGGLIVLSPTSASWSPRTGRRSSRRTRATASSASTASCAPPRSCSSPISASRRSRPRGRRPRTRSKDMPFGIIGSLVVCTVIYMLVAAIMTLLVPYTSLNVPDPVAVVGRRVRPAVELARQDHQDRRDHRPDLGGAGADVRPDAHLLHDGARRPAAARVRHASIRSSRRRGSTRCWSASSPRSRRGSSTSTCWAT